MVIFVEIASFILDLVLSKVTSTVLVWMQVYFKNLQVLRYRESYHREMCLGDEILHSKDLEILDLSQCIFLYKLPEKLGSLKNLSSICLDKCGALRVLPNSLGQLTKLKTLSLEGCGLLFAGGKNLPYKSLNGF
jgi:hypothetical protein